MGCLKAFSQRTVLIWTLLCNVVYILWCSGFRNYHYGLNDAALLYTYLAFSILTLLGVFLKRRAWVYFGVIVYIIAFWVSFCYFFVAWKASTSIDVSGLNVIAKMVAVHWPLHFFHSIKDFVLCLVLCEFYDREYADETKWTSGTKRTLNLVMFAKPAKNGQILLLLAHILAFVLMVVEFVHKLHLEKASVIVEENISYMRISSVRATVIQLLLVIIILMITYGIARKNRVLMTMGYLFHACFCLFALVDMILMIRGQAYWYSSEPFDEQLTNQAYLTKGVMTFVYSMWLARLLALYVSADESDDGSEDEPKPNSREQESFL